MERRTGRQRGILEISAIRHRPVNFVVTAAILSNHPTLGPGEDGCTNSVDATLGLQKLNQSESSSANATRLTTGRLIAFLVLPDYPQVTRIRNRLDRFLLGQDT